ncbi:MULTISPECIES: MFS transporter [Glutamicibacter]|uniref:MFS transporter n=1 Tax=Glutamicibacter halophytocola TaxID=1933880 RepID=A0AA95BRF6_9MICC|nr:MULTISPECIES: MFS transporter [Glutamicibacter]MBF6672268.1 MFS transporter [Glutamicibacter sp. FBE19]NQD40786.1 MFS transporter [Glutamicibacter halophytocola]UUX60280.1 MFS transporter [Glutamicibacter halophytocola]
MSFPNHKTLMPRIGASRIAPLPIGTKPTDEKSFWFVAALAFAQFALFVALLGPVMVSMAIKVGTLEDDPVAQTSMIGFILGTGAIAAVIGNVFFGRLSDRTRSRFGRRRPWMVLGSLVMLLGLWVISIGTNTPALMLGWLITQLGSNAALSAFMATLADQLPEKQYARTSAVVGIMQQVGILGSIWFATLFTANLGALFMVPGLVGVVGIIIYAAVLPDQVLDTEPPKLDIKEILRSFWVSPVQHPYYALVWWQRFLMMLATFLFTTFRLPFVAGRMDMDDATGAETIFTGVLIYTILLVPIGYLVGWLSDKTGHRKLPVALSATLFAIGTYLLFHVDSPGEFYAVEALLGAANGIYMGVDMALVLTVLPDRNNPAKDLGVFNIANAGPQSLAPYLGGFLLAAGASAGSPNFGLLLVVASAAALLSALLILPIKKVK